MATSGTRRPCVNGCPCQQKYVQHEKDLDAVTTFAALPPYTDQLEKDEAGEESTNGGIKEKEGDNTL